MNESDIHVIYGSQNIARMAYELMDAMDIAAKLPKDTRIALKPNFAVSKPADSGATTHPEVAEGILQYLTERGFRKIAIMEGSWAGADTKTSFRVCGFEALAKRYSVPLYDLKKDAFVERQAGGLTIKVCRIPLLETDYLINLPVLKAHCQTNLTCSLKNLKGCIPDSEKRRFHSLGLMKPIACLSSILRPNLTIVDAICGDLTFEEGGHPVPMDRLIGGADPVLVDSYGAELLGLTSGTSRWRKSSALGARISRGPRSMSTTRRKSGRPFTEPAPSPANWRAMSRQTPPAPSATAA